MPELSTLEKVPPQNLEAEMAVLGSMLLDADAISVAAESLDPSFFYKDSHKKIFESTLNLYAANKAVDLITLTDELKRAGALEDTGGASYLAGLVNSVPTAANIGHYVNIVREKSILRTLITNATRIVSLCYESEDNVNEVIDTAEQLVF